MTIREVLVTENTLPRSYLLEDRCRCRSMRDGKWSLNIMFNSFVVLLLFHFASVSANQPQLSWDIAQWNILFTRAFKNSSRIWERNVSTPAKN